jgi:MFS family permease
MSARSGYQRDAFTWMAFAVLGGFGILNAVLGPALPYLRSAEGISYVVASLHQVAYAVGGGLAGLLATREQRLGRAFVIRAGLAAAAVAGIGIGFGNRVAITVPAAFVVSLFASAAMIRLWAALADAHGRWRTVAMAEGEVAVSAGGIVTPLLFGALGATILGWRLATVAAAGLVVAAVAASLRVPIPEAAAKPRRVAARGRTRLSATLVAVFAIVALEFSLSFWLTTYLTDSVGVRRGIAASLVSVLYAANLLGRLLTSRLARRLTTPRLLAGSLVAALLGVVVLLSATGIEAALAGIGLAGAAIGATFPLVSSLHVGGHARGSDAALGEVLATAAIGQVLGPLAAGAIAQVAGLRVGLTVLPAMTLLALAALWRTTSGADVSPGPQPSLSSDR